MIGAEAYVDASKDTWRGWKWNAIANAALGFTTRIPPSEKKRRLSTKTVLYLVGPDDRDRPKALDRGFLGHNLIAVDLLQERVDAVRKAGGLAIRGSLQMILSNWPKDWPIDVIDGDFCSGLVEDVATLACCLRVCAGMHPDTVVSLNLMRGRDPASNSTRDNIARIGHFLRQSLGGSSNLNMKKHRGINWIAHLMWHFGSMIHGSVENGRYRDVLMDEDLVDDLINELWMPHFWSYRSKTSRQYFDSVVHRWGGNKNLHSQQFIESSRIAIHNSISVIARGDDALRGRIAALRAVRTKRIA